MELFFIGIFINKNKKNNNMSNEEKYCYKILDIIKNKKDLLLLEKQKIINEYKKQIYLSDDNKQRISIYNLLLILSEINEEKNKKELNNYEFNNILIGELLAKNKICINENKYIFKLLLIQNYYLN